MKGGGGVGGGNKKNEGGGQWSGLCVTTGIRNYLSSGGGSFALENGVRISPVVVVLLPSTVRRLWKSFIPLRVEEGFILLINKWLELFTDPIRRVESLDFDGVRECELGVGSRAHSLANFTRRDPYEKNWSILCYWSRREVYLKVPRERGKEVRAAENEKIGSRLIQLLKWPDVKKSAVGNGR